MRLGERDLAADQDILGLQHVELLGGAGLVLRTDQPQGLARELDRALRRGHAAVVALSPGATPDPDAFIAHCRDHLAGYKVPRTITFVDEVVRSPAGKADYRWAKAAARGGACP